MHRIPVPLFPKGSLPEKDGEETNGKPARPVSIVEKCENDQ